MGTTPSFWKRNLGTTLLQYVLAITAVVTALVVGSALHAWAGEQVSYVVLLPAIAFSAWYCGIGPSIVAIGLALANALYGFTPPIHEFRILTPAGLVSLLAFLFSSLVIVALAESRRRQNK